MKVIRTPIKLSDNEVVTSLYHSPFDYNLLYLILFAKTGVKLKIVLDDIDNIGVDRSHPNSGFEYKEKYFLSKTERTNLRPLSLTLPKHMLLNLAYPNIKDLDKKVSINALKNVLGYEDTVEHWIKDKTNEMGVYSLIGPNNSFAFMKIDENFIVAIKRAKEHLIALTGKFSNNNTVESISFIDWLFSEDLLVKGKSVSNYYLDILKKIIKKFNLSDNVCVERMSDQMNQYNNEKLRDLFKEDRNLQNAYDRAVKFLGNKKEDCPFYSISRRDGSRMLPIENYLNNPDDYIIAPKVLMLNNFENLILPDHAADSPNVVAREIMYQNHSINCNQVFCRDSWFNYLSQFDLDINLDKLEKEFYKKDTLNLRELSKLSFNEDNYIHKYKSWIVESTIRSIERAAYPLLFLSLLQDKVFYKKIPELYKITLQKI